jgi:predicted RNA binding protein YcfA (HicA-like mRNA interferase family)
VLKVLTHIKICAIIIYRKGETRMKSYSSKEVIKALLADGWYEVNVVGSHHQYKHPTKKGRTTVKHPDKDIPRRTLDTIERQSGLRFR